MKKRTLSRSIALATMLTLASGTLAANGAEQGTIYSCRDRAGRTITSDRPIPECSDRAVRELGPSGILKREIAAPLTPEQQRAKEIDDRNKRVADDAAREKKRRDSALLAAYSNEAQIESARHRALADAQENSKTSHAQLADLKAEKKALAQEGEFYKGKRMPPRVKRRLDDNEAAISDEEATIKMRQTDVERINQRYDDELKRFRELTEAGKGASR
ncbi:MAG: DUF4124 domain-containing protein [Burkholderiaceae bacterium]